MKIVIGLTGNLWDIGRSFVYDYVNNNTKEYTGCDKPNGQKMSLTKILHIQKVQEQKRFSLIIQYSRWIQIEWDIIYQWKMSACRFYIMSIKFACLWLK